MLKKWSESFSNDLVSTIQLQAYVKTKYMKLLLQSDVAGISCAIRHVTVRYTQTVPSNYVTYSSMHTDD